MKTIDVVAAIIQDDKKILATQRGYGEFEGGWEFPGGKVEEGESPEAAIVREIQEELEATIEVERYFTTIDYDYPQFHLHMDCFLCKLVDGHIELLEHEDARWVDAETIDSVDWLPADITIIEQIKQEGIV